MPAHCISGNVLAAVRTDDVGSSRSLAAERSERSDAYQQIPWYCPGISDRSVVTRTRSTMS